MSKKRSKPVVNVWLQGGARLAQRFGNLDEIESVLVSLYGKPSRSQRESMIEGYYRGKLSDVMDTFWQLIAAANNEQKKVIADDFERFVRQYEVQPVESNLIA